MHILKAVGKAKKKRRVKRNSDQSIFLLTKLILDSPWFHSKTYFYHAELAEFSPSILFLIL